MRDTGWSIGHGKDAGNQEVIRISGYQEVAIRRPGHLVQIAMEQGQEAGNIEFSSVLTLTHLP